MSNLIQIRRSTTSTTPASLANGEIAYSFAAAANTLWIGDPLNIVPGTPLRIAGGKYAFLHRSTLQGTDEGGVLTANAVVITNANNFLDQFKTNTLVIGPDGTTNAAATLVVSGTANISGNVTIGGVITATGGANYTGNIAFDTDTLFVDAANNRVGVLTTTPNAPLQVNGAANVEGAAQFSNTTGFTGAATFSNTITVSSATGFIGNVAFDTSTLFIDAVGNKVGVLTVTPNAPLQVNGAANVEGAAHFSNTVDVVGVTTFSNTVTLTSAVGFASNVAFDTTTMFVDATNNRVGFGTITPDATIQVVGTANVSGAVLIGGDVTAVSNVSISQSLSVTNSVSFSNTLTVTGNVNFSNTLTVVGASTLQGTLGVTKAATFSNTANVVGAVALSNTLTVTGNATFSNTISVTGEATFVSNVAFDTNTLFVDSVNNRVGVLTSTPDASLSINGTANVAGNTTIAGKLTQVANATFSNTITVVGNATFSNTISVTGAAEFLNTITGSANVNIDSGTLFVDTVNNKVGIGDTTPDVELKVVGDGVFTANVTANNLLINADATINGNLAVNGTLTTIDTVNLVVEDPLFKLAKNNNVANSAGDVVDSGFYGVYANTTADMYTGMFRDATDGKYKLFTGLTTEPTTTVDTSAPSFRFATLTAFLEIGGFVANNTNLTATANSTYNVSLTANTLTLANKLEVTSGGTGVASFTTNGVLFGNGSANLQVTSAGTTGDVLQVNGSGVPVFGTLDGGTF